MRPTARALSLLSLALVAALPCVAATADDEPEAFVVEMLRGIDAKTMGCVPEVHEVARQSGMTATCARFEGGFDAFERAWAEHLRRDEMLALRDGARRLPLNSAETAWEVERGTYHRIYSVGRGIVGVRFRDGDLVLVHR